MSKQIVGDTGTAAAARGSGGGGGGPKYSEAAMMAALVSKYGTDVDYGIRQPPSSRSQLVEYEILSPTSQGGDDLKQHAADAEGHAGGKAENVPGGPQLQVLEGGPLISQLIINHLKNSVGFQDVAEVFQQELHMYGYPRTYFQRESSPLLLPKFEGPGMPTALGQLLCPAVDTRRYIHALLTDIAQKIYACDANGHRRDDVTTRYLVSLVECPMWSSEVSGIGAAEVQQQAASGGLSSGSGGKHNKYLSPHTGQIRAASLNQLVERATDIAIHPNVGAKQSKLDADDAFIKSLCRTHRHFTSSHALLAKLLQRFFVPSFLPFTEMYEDHGITIFNPSGAVIRTVGGPFSSEENPLSSRTKYWIESTKKVQIRIGCFIARWLEYEPQHFDTTMCEAIYAWLEECVYPPSLWGEAPVELLQCGEFIKLALRNLEEANAGGMMTAKASHAETLSDEVEELLLGGRGGAMDTTRGGGSGGGSAAGALDIMFTRHRATVGASATHRSASGITGEVTTAGFSTRLPQTLMSTAGGMGTIGTTVSFLNIDDLRLANQITAMDHLLFRNIHYSELYVYATNNGARSLHSTNHPAMHLSLFLRRAEELMHWVVTEIVRPRGAEGLGSSGDADDEENSPEVRPILYQKFVSLMYRLLDMNNMHSAVAVLCALRHPVVTRLRALHEAISPSVLDSVAEIDDQLDFSKGYFGYKTYLKSIPDNDIYPAIPLVSMWVDEIRRLTCAEPTVLRDVHNKGLIHWRKFEVLSTIYEKLSIAQRRKVPAEFAVVPSCVRWLNERFTSAVHVPERLLELSLQLESSTGATTPVGPGGF